MRRRLGHGNGPSIGLAGYRRPAWCRTERPIPCSCFDSVAAFFGWAIARRILELRLEERVSERTRIARALHDTLLQSFQGLMLQLQVVDNLLPSGKAKEKLEQTLERADQAIAEGRDAVYDLRSSATTTNDWAQAVRTLCNQLATRDAAAFQLTVEGPTRELHPIVRDELYRITREALRNAFTHACAHHIEAELIYAERKFRLRIRDDGKGMEPAVLEGSLRPLWPARNARTR